MPTVRGHGWLLLAARVAWLAAVVPMPAAEITAAQPLVQITQPPPELRVPAFYAKYLDAEGYPIVASARVNDYAMREAAYIVNAMLAERPDVRRALIAGGSRLCIIGWNEFTTDLPEFADLSLPPGLPGLTAKEYWDARARGTGGSETDPHCSCGEENLLGYPGDPYAAECILIHEFAHTIHLRGMVRVDPAFDRRVRQAYEQALAAGLWKGTYASVNHREYFAEGVQSWFDDNRPPDHEHNDVDTRAELIAYDPRLAEICRDVFGDTHFVYTKPATRLREHLTGYDPTAAPRFVWPERLRQAKDRIRRSTESRP